MFDVIKGSGSNGLYTYPTDAATAYGSGPTLNAWTVDRDGVLIATAGHLHPGGMHTGLLLQHPPLRRAAPSRSQHRRPVEQRCVAHHHGVCGAVQRLHWRGLPSGRRRHPFDSGQLGVAGPPTAGRVTWTTPADLPAGTYTYFCRIHPAVRGAFRIEAPH